MPSYHVDRSTRYCSLCDRYFPSLHARASHVHFAPNHPKCDKCNTRFANGNSMRVHWALSLRHHYCFSCDKHFRSAAGLRVHIELAAEHCEDRSDPGDEDQPIDDTYEGWEEVVGRLRYPNEDDDEEPSVEEDVQIAPEDEYWSEDDEPDYLHGLSYHGHASVPAWLRREVRSGRISSLREAAFEARDTVYPSLPEEKPPPEAFYLNCPICLEHTAAPTATRCGHVFCLSCIQRALMVELSCPACRASASPEDLRALFLNVAA